jgi:hypothetical protein
METTDYITYGWIGLFSAVICGKWALELGYRQSRQLLWMIAGLVLAPMALLVLYDRLLHQCRSEGQLAGRW